MKLITFVLLALSVLSASVFGSAAPPSLAYHEEDPVVKHIRAISWSVYSDKGSGSGIMFTRKEGKDNIHFVWTAGHNVGSLQEASVKIDPKTRNIFVEVKYPEFEICQEEYEDGRIVGYKTYKAKVVRYSEYINGQDLALLRVLKRNITDKSVKFSNSEMTPIGSEVWHIGAMSGQLPNSLTFGVLSNIGIIKHTDKIYDQYTIPAQRGCSGGGVYLRKTGECVALLLGARMSPAEFNFSVTFARPIREIRSFAKRTKCEWALDAKVPLPYNDNEPVEDVPIPLPKGRFVPE
jgi:S1-C subfamily serine protease